MNIFDTRVLSTTSCKI